MTRKLIEPGIVLAVIAGFLAESCQLRHEFPVPPVPIKAASLRSSPSAHLLGESLKLLCDRGIQTPPDAVLHVWTHSPALIVVRLQKVGSL